MTVAADFGQLTNARTLQRLVVASGWLETAVHSVSLVHLDNLSEKRTKDTLCLYTGAT